MFAKFMSRHEFSVDAKERVDIYLNHAWQETRGVDETEVVVWGSWWWGGWEVGCGAVCVWGGADEMRVGGVGWHGWDRVNWSEHL